MTGEEDFDVVRHAFEQPQSDEVVLDRIRGVQVGHRNQDVGEHVAGNENATFFDQRRRMTLGVRRMLDNATSGPSQGIRAVAAGGPVIRPNRSKGVSSAISGGNPSTARVRARKLDAHLAEDPFVVTSVDVTAWGDLTI